MLKIKAQLAAVYCFRRMSKTRVVKFLQPASIIKKLYFKKKYRKDEKNQLLKTNFKRVSRAERKFNLCNRKSYNYYNVSFCHWIMNIFFADSR